MIFTGSKERREIQDSLSKLGSFNWNRNAEINNGELITRRRPNQKLNKKATDFKACPYCLGSYINLSYHVARKCPQRPTVNYEQAKGERIITVLSKTVEARYSVKANDGLRKMFDSMQEDDTLRLIKFDWLLIEFGNRICSKYNRHYNKGMKSNQLRSAGRILTAMKNISSEVFDFASIYQTKLFDSVVDAIKVVNKFDPITNEFEKPGPASTCVALIKRIGGILKSQYIRKRDPEKELETDKFLTLTLTDLPYVITKAITDTQSRMRRERVLNLPSSEDVQRLAKYISVERNEVFEVLKTRFSYKNWVKLSELTLASIIVFNRRRVGESRNIEVINFTGRDSFNEVSNGELFAALSESSKLVAKQYTRMQVRGKKGRTVPVLLKRDIEECIEYLLDHREKAGVAIDNPLLFALPSTIKTNLRYVKGWNVLNKIAKLCGAVKPSSLTGTNLRKHMATFCVSLELNDGLVSEVADFMGHAEKVHREYYRKNTVDRQIVTMAKLLEAAQGNCDNNNTEIVEGSKCVVVGTRSKDDILQPNVSKLVRKRKKDVKKGSENETGASQPKARKVFLKRNGIIKIQSSKEWAVTDFESQSVILQPNLSQPARKRKKDVKKESQNEMVASQTKARKVVQKRKGIIKIESSNKCTGTDYESQSVISLPNISKPARKRKKNVKKEAENEMEASQQKARKVVQKRKGNIKIESSNKCAETDFKTSKRFAVS